MTPRLQDTQNITIANNSLTVTPLLSLSDLSKVTIRITFVCSWGSYQAHTNPDIARHI